jgi:hypothetical protein
MEIILEGKATCCCHRRTPPKKDWLWRESDEWIEKDRGEPLPINMWFFFSHPFDDFL